MALRFPWPAMAAASLARERDVTSDHVPAVITGPRTLRRHHRACPGDPDSVERHALRIGMAGTGPAMTEEEGCDWMMDNAG
ncbi:hypothetical protein J4G37_06075 [Microvirga sp. 3-52]|nr:hypothetical protein [Microvirga sp. 3-52]